MRSCNCNQDGGLETFMRSQVKRLSQSPDSTALNRVGVLLELVNGQKFPFRITHKDLCSKGFGEGEISAFVSDGCLRQINDEIYEILERAYDLLMRKISGEKAKDLVKVYEEQFLPRKRSK